MATNYKKIAEEHEKRYGWDAKPRRIYKRLYSNKTHFIYVVLNATTQPERYIIQNPTDKVAVDERYDVRYQVPFSEITEHGKLV